MSQAAETIGQRLRAERERRALSAEKAADDLHFDISVVEALEAGDFARLGPAVYGKGHLKRYAEFLGLPAAEMLELFASRPADSGAGSGAAALRMPAEPATGGEPNWLQAAGTVAAAAAVAVLLLWWKPWQAHAVAAGASPASAVPALSAAAAAGSDSTDYSAAGRTDSDRDEATAPAVDAAAGVPGPAIAALGATAASPASPSPAERSAGVGRATLRLRFSADSWVDVHDAAGVRVFAGRGRANSVKTLVGAAPMRVYIGFASGVQLEVNNHAVAIGPQFVAGDVARFEAGADGVLRRDVHAHDMAARGPQPRP